MKGHKKAPPKQGKTTSVWRSQKEALGVHQIKLFVLLDWATTRLIRTHDDTLKLFLQRPGGEAREPIFCNDPLQRHVPRLTGKRVLALLEGMRNAEQTGFVAWVLA
jgi:hypothetical protein